MTDYPTQLTKDGRKGYKRLQIADKKAVIADYCGGMTQEAIAAKYNVHRATIARVVRDFKEECPQAEITQGTAGYKDRLKGKAVVAVTAGLDDPTDNYKRGNLGVQVLKGIGEFSGDSPKGDSLNILIANMPSSLYREAMKAGCFEMIPDAEEEGRAGMGTQLPEEATGENA